MKSRSVFTPAIAALVACITAQVTAFAQSPGLPRPGEVPVTSYERWAAKGFQRLRLPELGETAKVLHELNSGISLFPGVQYLPPSFGRGLSQSAMLPSEIYDQNLLKIRELMDYGPLVAEIYWANTQRGGGAWDYKALVAGGSKNGYYNGAFSGAQLFPKGILLGGFGIYKIAGDVADMLTGGKWAWYGFPWSLTQGNRPESFIYAETGYEYYDSGQYIRDFIDEARDMHDERFPSIRNVAEFNRVFRMSAAEEMQRRWDLLKELAKVQDSTVFKVMEARTAALQRQAEEEARLERERIDGIIRAQREQQEEEHKRQQQQYAPPPQFPSPMTTPTPVYNPPCFTCGPPPSQTRAPPMLQPVPIPPWHPLPYFPPYREAGGGSGGGTDCDDCGEPVGTGGLP